MSNPNEGSSAVAFVLNLLITGFVNGGEKVLVAIRHPEVNERHPGVVSLPTMRIPRPIGLSLSMEQQLAITDKPVFKFITADDCPVGSSNSGSSLTSFLVESLMSRKLGAGDLLETKSMSGRCAFQLVAEGLVDDPTGTSVTERTTMYTVRVSITHGCESMPVESAAYSAISWVDPDLLCQAWKQRDAQMIFPDANPFQICIRGLCIRSGIELLSH